MSSLPSTPPEPFAALLGIDWADQQHAVALWDCASGQIEHSTLPQQPEAIAAWATALQARFGGQPLAVCLEQTKGALIYALLAYEFLVLYPINPATSALYRQAFATSRAKDDPADALICLELLRHHRDKLRPWRPEDAPTRELRQLLEKRRRAVDLRTQLTNSLRDELKCSFPQALTLTGEDLHAQMAGDFLLRWPSLQALQKTRKETLRKFYYAHNARRMDLLEQRLAAIASMVPLTSDPAVLAPAALSITMLARQLLTLRTAIAAFEERIAALYAAHPDRPIFDSLPGAGPTLGPRLLAAFGTDRARFASPRAIQQYSGIAPVTERSGKSTWVHRRWSRPKFIHQTFFEYAGQSALHCPWARAFLAAQKARGKSHPTAVRALAFKWQRILFTCWRQHQPYDESLYLAALKTRGSHLSAKLEPLSADVTPATCS
jgi:transposase